MRRPSRGARRQRLDVESVQQERGVGEQSDGGCPHTDDALPCSRCFFQEGDVDE
jgi:hypothetical protein